MYWVSSFKFEDRSMVIRENETNFVAILLAIAKTTEKRKALWVKNLEANTRKRKKKLQKSSMMYMKIQLRVRTNEHTNKTIVPSLSWSSSSASVFRQTR